MPDNLPFGPLLKDYRKGHDLTQEELAEQVGCSTDTIKKIEAGKLRPSKQLAQLLAERLVTTSEARGAFVQAARADLCGSSTLSCPSAPIASCPPALVPPTTPSSNPLGEADLLPAQPSGEAAVYHLPRRHVNWRRLVIRAIMWMVPVLLLVGIIVVWRLPTLGPTTGCTDAHASVKVEVDQAGTVEIVLSGTTYLQQGYVEVRDVQKQNWLVTSVHLVGGICQSLRLPPGHYTYSFVTDIDSGCQERRNLGRQIC